MKIVAPDVEGVNLLRSKIGAEQADGQKALREFDAYFLAQLLKSGNQDGEDSLFDGGSAGRMYRDYFHEEVARVLAQQGSIGLSQELADKLEKPGAEVPQTDREGQA